MGTLASYMSNAIKCDALFFLAVYFDNSKSNCSMDDSKGLNDHQHSAVNYAAVYNAENGCLATIKVHQTAHVLLAIYISIAIDHI